MQQRLPGLKLKNVGPIRQAAVSLHDLTVLVGPQASGKSIFLQTLKLVMDRRHIMAFFEQQNVAFNKNPSAVMSGYFGRGMGGMLDADPAPGVTWLGRNCTLESLAVFRKSKSLPVETLFYIPAQRVVSLQSGASRTFDSFDFGDPYVLRYFAHQVHILLQNEFGARTELFPVNQRLNPTLRDPIAEDILRGARLSVELRDFTKTMLLQVDPLKEGLPFLAWSAGQREFVPLLLGIYWLCPAGRVSRRDEIEWVVIEEPEMGLHPRAISAFLLLVLELMKRGYRVIISTHSTVVLDLVWALQRIKQYGGNERDVRKLFRLKSNPATKSIADNAVQKTYGVYFFEPDKTGTEVTDISALNPADENHWGDLNGFASRSSDVVASVVNRAEANEQ